jgi:hypothetical protein
MSRPPLEAALIIFEYLTRPILRLEHDLWGELNENPPRENAKFELKSIEQRDHGRLNGGLGVLIDAAYDVITWNRARCFAGTFNPSLRQMRCTRSLPTCHPRACDSAVIRL